MAFKLSWLFSIFFTLAQLISWGQSYSHKNSVMADVKLVNNDAHLLISWDVDTNAVQYTINRRLAGSTSWGGLFATLPGNETSFIDSNVISGTVYEYRVIKNADVPGFGYVFGAIDAEIDHNPGVLLLLVDSIFFPALSNEILQMKQDIEADGWFVHLDTISRTESPQQVKALIQSEYENFPELKSIVLLGHIPVPYAGDLNPDGHPDHQGAWPADGYYGDMNGYWTDTDVTNVSAAAVRNQNVPGDGKFDQSVLPSLVELEVSRIDFYNLPVFNLSEEQLTLNYLLKLHDFKTHQYIPSDSAVVEDNFLSFNEGFAGSAFSSFSAIIGKDKVVDGDYGSYLLNRNYLWSYGTGPGWYSGATNIVNSTEFAVNNYNSTFTMLFGSYFGDWDTQDNLLRSALGSGKILCSSWSGRPYYYYHPMGLGKNIGSCIRLSQNNTSAYFPTYYVDLGLFSRWVHIAQMGDGSLRSHYLSLPSNAFAQTLVDGSIELNWQAALNVDGYHIYRRGQNEETWTKLTAFPIVTTSFTDNAISIGGDYLYLIRSAKKITTGSGRYWNQGLGIQVQANSTVAISNSELNSFVVYPNPTSDFFTISTSSAWVGSKAMILDLSGKEVMEFRIFEPQQKVTVTHLNPGVYFIIFRDRVQKILIR